MENLGKIKFEYYETGDFRNQSYFKNLTEEGKKNYLLLYELYSNLLYQYFIQVLNLKEYDDLFATGEISYKEVATNNMDFYQYLATDYLKYLYIRNNIYIERLSDEELKFLRDKYISGDFSLDDSSKIFIEKTFLKVILEELTDKKININYGPDSLQFYKPVNAIIIGMRFDDYYREQGIDSDEWASNYQKQLQDIDIIFSLMKREFKKIGIPIEIIKYNNFSIKPIETEQLKK